MEEELPLCEARPYVIVSILLSSILFSSHMGVHCHYASVVKRKAAPVADYQATKAYRNHGGIAPHILYFDSG
jgi:hypothetical protein